jgi:hypothetical protein
MHSVYSSTVRVFSFAPRYRSQIFSSCLQALRKGRCSTLVGALSFSFLLCGSMPAAQLTVAWDDNSSTEIGFKVERSTNGSTFTTVAVVGANQTNYADASVVSATTYWYRVKAYDLLQSSPYSNVTSATTPSSSTATPPPTSSTAPSGSTARIKALTARATTEYNDPQSLILNFSVTGSSKSILLRGIGPGLTSYTSSKVLPDPKLRLYVGSNLTASNDNWGGTSSLVSAFNQAGAFPLSAYSKDAALVKTLSVNSYKSVVNGSYSGLAQTEIYDADTSTAPAGRLSKVSVRGLVKTGSGVLVSGFVVAGETVVKLLIRAIGPSLTELSTGRLNDPQLSVHKGSTLVGQNDNWSGNSTLATAFTQVGAPSLSSYSRDSALLLTLAPGTYSATVSGVSSTSGIARLEMYVMP